MIKGLAITPPILGRISIGRVVERNGKRLPEKDDQFTITSQIQGKEGWLLHPLDHQLREQTQEQKLRSIPISLLFNDPALNLRADYHLFDRASGRPVCVGDGTQCRRHTQQGIQQLPCPAPEACEIAKAGCKPYGRLYVRIGEDDELGCFIFRTTGFNSIRTLAARLSYLQAASGNLLSCLPLSLKLRGKSTTQSHRAPIFYADITVRDGLSLAEAIAQAKATAGERAQAGIDQAALEEVARAGLQQAMFETNEEDVPDILEEFYPAGTSESERSNGVIATSQQPLKESLAVKVNK